MIQLESQSSHTALCECVCLFVSSCTLILDTDKYNVMKLDLSSLYFILKVHFILKKKKKKNQVGMYPSQLFGPDLILIF